MSVLFIYTFIFATDLSHFRKNIEEEYLETDLLSQIETYIVLLLFPHFCVLFYKTYYGIRWMRLNFKRSAFQSYYLTSLSFYISFTVQEIIIIVYSWKLFRPYINWLEFYTICVFLILSVLLRMNMTFLDRQNFAINLIRRDA